MVQRIHQAAKTNTMAQVNESQDGEEAPVIVTFEDVSASAYRIRKGIKKTPCEVKYYARFHVKTSSMHSLTLNADHDSRKSKYYHYFNDLNKKNSRKSQNHNFCRIQILQTVTCVFQ